MPSPFPGMDPYLEGYLWPDVHNRLVVEIARRLAPLLRPRYVARIEVSVVKDENPEAEIGILYPDIEVLRNRARTRDVQDDREAEKGTGLATILTAPITIPRLDPIEVRLSRIEVRDTSGDELVTTIEILSPVNKRGKGL